MSSMVAVITSPMYTHLQGATRARAPSHTCTVVALQPFKPNPLCNLRETNLTPDTRWGSRSRDPIGYFDGVNLYRTYFIPSKLDPSGQKWVWCDECKLGEFRNSNVVAIGTQNASMGANPDAGDDALYEIAVLEVAQKVLNLANGSCATLTKEWETAIMEVLDAKYLPSAGATSEGVRKAWNRLCQRNKLEVHIWVKVKLDCCTSASWPLGNYWNENQKWYRCKAGGIFPMPLNFESNSWQRAKTLCQQLALKENLCVPPRER